MTTKPRKDELGEYLMKQGVPRKKQWAELLAIKDEIEADLMNGYSMNLIWNFRRNVKKQTNASYDQFRRFVNKQIINKENSENKKSAKGEKVAGGQAEKSAGEPVNKKPKKDGFTFNPTPNIKDLV